MRPSKSSKIYKVNSSITLVGEKIFSLGFQIRHHKRTQGRQDCAVQLMATSCWHGAHTCHEAGLTPAAHWGSHLWHTRAHTCGAPGCIWGRTPVLYQGSHLWRTGAHTSGAPGHTRGHTPVAYQGSHLQCTVAHTCGTPGCIPVVHQDIHRGTHQGSHLSAPAAWPAHLSSSCPSPEAGSLHSWSWFHESPLFPPLRTMVLDLRVQLGSSC